jgi:coronin-1B/1C/6
MTLPGHKKRVDCLEFNPIATGILATGSLDKSLRIWDISTGKELFNLENLHEDAIQGISWNYNGSLLATVSKDKKIRIIDPREGKAITVRKTPQSFFNYVLDRRSSSRIETESDRLARKT